MIGQDRNVWFAVVCKFAVGTVAYSRSFTIVPDETSFWIRYFPLSLSRVCATATAITGDPVFLQVIGSMGRRAPVMTVCTDFAIGIKIIEKHKLFCKPVQVGGYSFSK